MTAPAPPPVSTVVANGALRLRCLVWGTEHDPTVVLVHGNGAHAYWWAPLVPALVARWRVVALDLRGHGESTWPEAPAYAMADYAADLAAVAAALTSSPFALVGHSMGGRIALWYAAHHAGQVRALGVLDARFDPIVPEEAARYRTATAGARAGKGYATKADALAAFRFVPDEPGVPSDVATMLAEHAVVERGPGDWTFRFDRAVLRVDGDGGGDLRRFFPVVRCPVLVGRGRESWVLDRAGCDRLVAALPDAEGRTFRGGHHFPLTDAAALGSALREFLGRRR